ncbi:MAG: L,D-transpeptidase family protein [Micavibrio sp.]|nr:L,D-transpeptidase family protein [Micavibrio sp.]
MRGILCLLSVLPIAVMLPSKAFAKYDLPYVGEMIEYETNEIDTFVHLARDYNLGFTELRAANPYVDPWLPGEGEDIVLPARHILPDAPHEGIVINVAEMRLFSFMQEDEPKSYPIGVGREGLNTPIGKTKVVRKADGPVWRPTERMRREDPKLKEVYYQGPDNPMGTHALYLGIPLYAIHGTNKPFGIGRRSSSGCIRMYPESITEVFEMVPVGTPVEIVNQPIKLAWIDDKLYMEAHPTLEQAIDFEEKGVASEEKMTNSEMKYLIEMAGAHSDRLNWPAIRTAVKERKGYPVAIARRPRVVADSAEAMKSIKAAELPEEAKALVKSAKGKDSTEDAAISNDSGHLDEPAIMVNSGTAPRPRNFFNE